MRQFISFSVLIYCVAFSTYAQRTKQETKKQPEPFVLGEIQTLKSEILGESRILNIYLPEGYDPKDSISYPVIYLLDGSADEDFIHVVGLVQFANFPWVELLPKSIVVGIANVDRKRDFTFPSSLEEERTNFPTSGHSDKFIAFIANELKPFINKTYKTNSESMLIGQSLGGLLATEILLKRPELFTKYIIISPSIWWDNGSILTSESSLLKEEFISPISIYLAVGKEGLAPSTVPHVMEVDANLLYEKIKNSKSTSVKIFFDYLPDEDHASISHQAIFNAFKVFHSIK